jgi:L-alanine-DL-glutamate epimerase-like enolase superfamily enzyme
VDASAGRIVSVQARAVSVGRRAPFTSALGVSRAGGFGIVQVETDARRTGLGEISMIWNGDGPAYCPMVAEILGPALDGLDAFDITRAIQRMDAAVQFTRAANPAKAAVEMALHDIVGQTLGAPVYQLLGGLVRERIVLSMSISMADVEGMVAQARDYVARGFTGVKVKVGLDPDHDVAAVRAIREAVGPRTTVRVDANMGWTAARQALDVIRALVPYRVHSVEQPLPADRLDDLAWLRDRSPIPIMVDESVWGPDDAYRVIRAGAADILNVYVSEAGGLRNAMRIFEMAQTAGLQCTIGSMPELGIGTAAAVHLAAAAPMLLDPSDVCGVLYNAESLVNETFDIADGVIRPPTVPGLGVSLAAGRLAVLTQGVSRAV